MNEINYYTTSSYSTVQDSGSVLGLALFSWLTGAMLIATIIITIAAYAFSAICLGRIFKKAGVESWIAWVPFFNTWKLFELGDQKGAYILFMLIPFVGQIIFAVFMFMAMYKIGIKFGKGGEFILLAIFLSPVWYIMLAFGKAQWNSMSATTTQPPVINSQPPQVSQ